MKQPPKPSFIKNWRETEAPAAPPNAGEDFGFASELTAATGISHFRVAHLRIPSGTRAYPPLAMDDLEIFACVLEGTPDLWADGYLHPLQEGHGIPLKAGTGLVHSLINNANLDARVFVFTEAFRRNSRAVHPLEPQLKEQLAKSGMLWEDAPLRRLGPNDGTPGMLSGRKRKLPDFVAHWGDLLEAKAGRYPNSDEDQTLSARVADHARFSRIAMRVQVLKPGRRTSWPHAERDESEFVYVVAGKVDAWNDGWITRMGEGDFIGWKNGTGITHAILNNSNDDAVIIVGGERSRYCNQYWYPFHPSYNKEIGKAYWSDHPVPRLGPHDGLPDRLREKVPARLRRSAVSANEAARNLGKLRES
ncbi:MAG: cupin domain-containing protein [Alphaproteobacteria bacterium]|nr:cupin domain-containing protein [Alphaproteobacteria bacterium]